MLALHIWFEKKRNSAGDPKQQFVFEFQIKQAAKLNVCPLLLNLSANVLRRIVRRTPNGKGGGKKNQFDKRTDLKYQTHFQKNTFRKFSKCD